MVGRRTNNERSHDVTKNRQATTRRSTEPYGRRETPGRSSDEDVRRASEMAKRIETFNGDWSAINLRKKTVKNSNGQSTDDGG